MTVTAQFPVEEITASAREVKFSRIALTLVLGFFWVAGWLAAHAWLAVAWALGYAWLGAVMCALAVRRGWIDGMPRAPQQLRQEQPLRG